VPERNRPPPAEAIPTGAGPARVGLSIGMAEAGPEHSAAAILDQADRGMYRDKASRRGSSLTPSVE
jgi:GGDEF domain-containing protein